MELERVGRPRRPRLLARPLLARRLCYCCFASRSSAAGPRHRRRAGPTLARPRRCSRLAPDDEATGCRPRRQGVTENPASTGSPLFVGAEASSGAPVGSLINTSTRHRAGSRASRPSVVSRLNAALRAACACARPRARARTARPTVRSWAGSRARGRTARCSSTASPRQLCRSHRRCGRSAQAVRTGWCRYPSHATER
jgi:hypothetical protein